jgi:hypothetical protein
VLTDRPMLRRQAGPARVGFVCQRSLPWLGRSRAFVKPRLAKARGLQSCDTWIADAALRSSRRKGFSIFGLADPLSGIIGRRFSQFLARRSAPPSQ